MPARWRVFPIDPRWIAVAIGLAIYAVPLYLPPAGTTVATPDGLARLFPGVPPAWVALRLLALAAAAVLGAGLAPASVSGSRAREAPAPAPTTPVPGARRVRAALVLAALSAASAFAVPHLGRPLQAAWLASLALPAWVLRGRTERAPHRPHALFAGTAVAGVLAAWAVSRVVASLHSPRAADVVDTWAGLQWLSRAIHEGRNVLVEGFLTGQTALNTVFQGALLFPPGSAGPEFPTLQLVHGAWVVLVGLGIAWLAAVRISPLAAPVCAAVFVFSPFALLVPLTPAVVFVGPLFATGLLVLLLAVYERGSPSALAALGPWAGLAATNPALAPLALGVLACAAWRLRHRRALLAVAGLGCVAALLPALPALADFGRMLGDYTEGRGDWIALESVLFGQRSPVDVPALWQSGRAGPIDVPLSALIAPFAIARQPIRLWGDALLDPVGGALAALGLALCARRAWRSAEARFVLLALAAAIVPAFVSSYDRVSLTRLFAAPVILALLAGLGFRVLQRAWAPQRGRAAALVVTLGVSLGGTWLFDAVNPRILRASWLSIALESLAPHDASRPSAVLVSYGGGLDLSWLHVGRIASHVPERPVAWLRFDGPSSLAAADDARAEVLLWSPALEADAGISRAVCTRWPGSTLYTLEDRPGRSRARAASLPGAAWAPSLPPTRWSVSRCPP